MSGLVKQADTEGSDSVMSLFLSTFVNKIDKKGRVSVPASFRAALAAQPYQGIVCYPSFTAAAIEGNGMAFMERLSASLDDLDAFSSEQDDLQSLIFAQCQQLAWDAEGRVVLPEALIVHAGLTETAAFVGKGRTFQIWQPQAHEDSMRAARERAMKARPTIKLSGGDK